MPSKTGIVLCVLGCLLLLLASSAFWMQSNFDNPERFSQLAAEAIQRPDVSQQVAHALWQGLANKYLAGFPLFSEEVEPAIASALQKESARSLVTRMASHLHASLIASEPTDWTIVLGSDYPLIVEAVLNINPELLPVFPGQEQIGVVTLAPGSEIPRLGGFARILPWVVVLAGVLGGILTAAGIYAADRRSQAVLACGLTLALGGAALLALEFVAPRLAVRLMEGDGTAGLVADAVYAMTRQLRLQTAVIAGLGVLVAAAGGMAASRRPQPPAPAAPWAGRP